MDNKCFLSDDDTKCFVIEAPFGGSYQKSVKADPHRGRLEKLI